MSKELSRWVFIVGAALALGAALVPILQGPTWVAWAIFTLGLVVGLMNVHAAGTPEFLVACLAFIVAARIGALPVLGDALDRMLANLVLFVTAAALIGSVRMIMKAARPTA